MFRFTCNAPDDEIAQPFDAFFVREEVAEEFVGAA